MLTTTAIANRIATYIPKSISTTEWGLAGQAVRDLVTAAEPTTVEDAKCLLSTLCTYLATPCGWDRAGVPDLEALLRDAAIEAFKAAFSGSTKTRDNHVGRLRSLQRALVGITRVAGLPRPKARHASRAVRLAHDVCGDTSIAALAAVVDAATGAPLTTDRLRGLTAELARATVSNVTGRQDGTLPVDNTVLDAYLDTADCEIPKGVVRATKPNRKQPTKPMSRRQQTANERAERAAIHRIQNGPRLSPEPDPETLDPRVREAIQEYRPADLPDEEWTALRPLTCRLVMGYRPPSVVSARNAASIVVSFLQWVWGLSGRPEPARPPDAVELLSTPLVEQYAGPRGSWMRKQNAPAETIASARTVLRRAVRSLDADHQDARFAYVPIDPPYTPAECDQFVWLALSQPTEARSRNACFLIGLGLGAGLGSSDLRLIQRKHIATRMTADGTTYLVVTVPGANGRTVPIRHQYAELVTRALELSADEGPEALVLGKKATRRNVTYVASHGMVTARRGRGVDIQTHRLRTTWLFACMNAAVPLADLLRMAGLKSARSLGDLLPLCPRTDPVTVETLTAQVLNATPQLRPKEVAA